MKVLNSKDYRHVVLKDDDGKKRNYCDWVYNYGCPPGGCHKECECPAYKLSDEPEVYTHEEAVAWWKKQK